MTEFGNKVAAVTGSASGIGLAAAVAFSSNGAHVVLIDLNEKELEKAVQKCKSVAKSPDQQFLGLHGDLAKDDFREKIATDVIKKFGKIDILVNNAGIFIPDNMENFSLEAFDKIFSVNARAPYHLSALFTPHLKKTKGAIVNISSMAALDQFPNNTSYSMSKAAIANLTRLAAAELATSHVRVNAICPGYVRTPIFVGHDEMAEKARKMIPFGRFAEPEEMAHLILFLASDKNLFMTGSVIAADGGVNVIHRI